MPESKLNTIPLYDQNIKKKEKRLKLNRRAFPLTTNICTSYNIINDTLQCRFNTDAPILLHHGNTMMLNPLQFRPSLLVRKLALVVFVQVTR